ncbi:MAG: hypothetical protein KTR30_12895 [Saprospiraceae bacterium]|nr:hypothetical protein [Saprospiraceae bacterium]
MKTKKITYVVFVTATLLSAILLFVAIHLTDPLVLKYRATVSSICAGDSTLENEADVLAAYPELSSVKDKIQALKQIRCQLQQMETSPTESYQAKQGREISHCKKRVARLVQEINQLILEVEQRTQLAQRA